ncbi:MAG: phosphatase PAP2 family protein [Clostridiales bacterium]|jgi:undecaprenyl-diphosphatase|nr:phosphatase PAP2 family protein [Clostridiales bacterium]
MPFENINPYEIKILDWIQSIFQSNALDTIAPYVTKLGDSGVVMIICAVVLLFFKKTRKIGFAVAGALILELVIVNITMKPLFMRTRPYDVNTGVNLLIPPPGDYSFPSGHSASAFAFAVSVLIFNKKIGIPAVILAFAVALSRLYLYVHYPSDVLSGIIIGILLALVSSTIVKAVYKQKDKKAVKQTA